MGWRAIGLFVALLPAYPVQKLVADRAGHASGFAASAAWLSTVTAIALLATSLSDLVRLGPFGWREAGAGVVGGVLLFVLGGGGYVVTERLLEIARPPESTAFASAGPGALVLVGVSMIAVVAAEEVAFRGVVLGALRDVGGTTLAVLASATAFAIYHLSLHQLVSTWIYGVVLAALTLWAGGLWPALVAHLTLNGLGLALSTVAAGSPSGGG